MEQTKTMLLNFTWLVLFLLLGTSAAALVQTAQEIAQNAFASTVLLVMEDANGQPLSLGSGFFVRNGEIASNLHVVEGAARGYAKLVGQKTKYDIEGITAVDPERDLVVLKISAAGTIALPLGNSDAVQVGESVYAVGNPHGLEGTFSQGIVSSIREVGTDKLLQITAPISPGSSGGPVLNTKGEVIGVSVATFGGGQNLNFAIPSNYIRTLLGKTGTAKPFVEAKPTKTQRSILADLGGHGPEAVVASQLTWEDVYNQTGRYSLSFQNQLRQIVKNVYCLVIFYDAQGNPIDVDVVRYPGLIPAGLAKRVTSSVDGSVQRLTTAYGSMSPRTMVEFRILDFEITDESRELYYTSYRDLIRGNYQLALIGFRQYLQDYPNTDLSDNANYWIGEVYYAQGRFQKAVEEFGKVISLYPNGDKVPSALLKIGYAYISLHDYEQGKLYLQKVVQEHSNSEEAKLARGRLATLE